MESAKLKTKDKVKKSLLKKRLANVGAGVPVKRRRLDEDGDEKMEEPIEEADGDAPMDQGPVTFDAPPTELLS